MPKEIERKFLVKCESWRQQTAGPGVEVRQGYLDSGKGSFRVRVAGDKGFITLKAAREGIVRDEFEYEIPVGDAREIIASFCRYPLIEKTRYNVEQDGIIWEIDEFHGDNSGLVIAEVELMSEEQSFTIPSWAGKEVSFDPRYYNQYLTKRPYSKWK
ncbi:MAG: adenylate cyclase [Lentisphaerae bacterium GWF2_52_8]|nr:MAG: adenylate cyclase [Lentisphaerae bacterium GWF2_52_8]